MVALTWRNVDAPSFRDTLDAYRLGAETLNKGLEIAKGSLTGFEDRATAETSAHLIGNLLTNYQGDPTKLNTDIAAGKFAGYDPRRLNPAAMALLSARPKDLQAFAQGTANLDQTKVQTAGMEEQNAFTSWAHGESKEDRVFQETDRDASIAARPLSATYNSFLDGTPEGEAKANAYISSPEAQALIAKLPAADQLAIRAGGASLVNGILSNSLSRERILDAPVAREGMRISNEGGRIANATGQFNLDSSKEDRAAETAAFNAAQIALTAAPDADTARNILMSSGLSGRGFNAALAVLEGRFPGLVGSIPQQAEAAAGGGAGGGDPSRIMNYEARGIGINAVPANVKNLGQAADFAKEVNRRGAPSSAMGFYQITGETMRDFGPRVFGANWRDTEFNQAAQDKLGEAIFNASRGSAKALSGRWTSLNLAEAERVRKMPWAQARVEIARGESGATATQLQANPAARPGANQSRANRIELGFRQGGNAASSISNDWSDLNGDRRDIGAVVTELRGSAFKGVSEEFLLREVREIQDRTGGNAAQAAAILKRSVTDQGTGTLNRAGRKLYNGLFGSVVEGYNPDLPGGKRVSEDRVNAFVREVRSGDVVGNAVEGDRLGNVDAQIQQAQSVYQAADARFRQAMVALNAGDQRQQTVLPRLQKVRDDAYRNLIMLNGQVGSSPYSRYNPPATYSVGGIPGVVNVRGTR